MMDDNRAPAPDVVGPAEARRLLGGISSERLRHLTARADFPKPRVLEIGRVWDRAAVKAFQFARTEPRRRAMTRFIAHYRRHGNVAAAATRAGVHRVTGYRWLHELEVDHHE